MSSKTAGDSARRWSLAARLTAWYTASTFVLILAAVGFLYWALVATLEHEDDQFLLDKASMVLAILREAPADLHELRAEIERESGTQGIARLYLRVLDASGMTIAATTGMDQLLPVSDFASAVPFDTAARHSMELESMAGTPRRTFRAIAVKVPGEPARNIHVAMDRTIEEDLLFRFRCYAGATLVVSLLVCGIVGHGLARRGLRPIQDITLAARRVQSSTLHERLDDSQLPSELANLAGTFNEMLNRLEDSFRRLERFSADIAHELRTPINNLRGETEVALNQPREPEHYREVLTSGLEEYARLSHLIDSLLFLARAESPQTQVIRERLDVARELATVREFFAAATEEAGVTLKVHAAAGVSAALDRTQFQQAISNLIGNALAHTPRGGSITLNATGDGDTVTVEVADTGTGIAAEHLPHVFDRFYRADPSRTSSSGSVGLGLALVKSIAALHGGTCTIESDVGRGTRVRLVFPKQAKGRST